MLGRGEGFERKPGLHEPARAQLDTCAQGVVGGGLMAEDVRLMAQSLRLGWLALVELVFSHQLEQARTRLAIRRTISQP